MTAIDPTQIRDDAAEARRTKRFASITKMDGWFKVLGLPWLTPILKIIAVMRQKPNCGIYGDCWACHLLPL